MSHIPTTLVLLAFSIAYLVLPSFPALKEFSQVSKCSHLSKERCGGLERKLRMGQGGVKKVRKESEMGQRG